jgi:glycosyltransferase involved in cell wall biosynthesis
MTNPPFLTIVIPTYNEETRILDTLQTVAAYLAKQEYTSEVIVVDDGSSDRTRDIVRSFIAGQQPGQQGTDKASPRIKLLENEHRGKGYTVRTGMLRGEAKYILFTDADLATPVSEVGKVIGSLEAGADVAIGTREGIGSARHNEPLFRHLVSRTFNLLVRLVAGLSFPDTQCSFKGFRREVAQDLFRRVQLYGTDAKQIRGSAVTGFDVELLYLAVRAGYRIEEIPVRWQYRGAKSTVNLIVDAVRMFGDVVKVRWLIMRGVYESYADTKRTNEP